MSSTASIKASTGNALRITASFDLNSTSALSTPSVFMSALRTVFAQLDWHVMPSTTSVVTRTLVAEALSGVDVHSPAEQHPDSSEGTEAGGALSAGATDAS